jgi:hypothetical protein
MPIAVLIAGLTAIALAFAAISAVLLIRTMVVDPLKAGAAAVSEVAVVGGVLSWALWTLAQFIEGTFAGMAYLAQVGQRQASDWWNYLVNQTVLGQFWTELSWVHWLQSISASLANVLNYFPALWSYTLYSLAPSLATLTSSFWTHIAWVDKVQNPLIAGIASDLRNLYVWADTVEIPLVRGIEGEVQSIRDFITSPFGLAREIGQSQARAEAYARSLAVPIAAAVTAIEQSPCQRFCSPLGDLGQLLQGLENAGMLAIMIAMVEAAMHDPAGLEAEIARDIVPPIRGVLSGLQLGIPD